MRQIIFVGLAIAAVVGSAYAHHSFAQYYFEDRSITIEGELVRFDYKNPHAWVYLDTKDEQGMIQQYSAEWANPNRLSRDNITRDSLKAGDHVAAGNPQLRSIVPKRLSDVGAQGAPCGYRGGER